MMIRDGKIYRNLEEQVLKNMEDIEGLQSTIGSEVVANPSGVASDILHKLQVGDVIYSVDGGESGEGIIVVKLSGDSGIISDADLLANMISYPEKYMIEYEIDVNTQVFMKPSGSTNLDITYSYIQNNTQNIVTRIITITKSNGAWTQTIIDEPLSSNAVWGQITGNISDQVDLKSDLDAKQNKLIAGANITIVGDVISASGTLASAAWGQIAGNIADQADLSSALAEKQDIIDVNHKLNAEYVSGLATVATTGSYNDLTDKPTTPVISYPVTDVEVNGNSALVDTVAKITVPTDTADLTNGAGFTTNTGTVTSVRVQTGSGLESSVSTAQTSALDTTISIASGYKLPTINEWNGKQDALPTVVNDKYLHTNALTGELEWSSVSGGGGGSTYTAGNGIDITNDVISLAYPSIIILEEGD